MSLTIGNATQFELVESAEALLLMFAHYGVDQLATSVRPPRQYPCFVRLGELDADPVVHVVYPPQWVRAPDFCQALNTAQHQLEPS